MICQTSYIDRPAREAPNAAGRVLGELHRGHGRL